MTGREFRLAIIPGLEGHLNRAREALESFDEAEFQEWRKHFDKLQGELAENFLRAQWKAQKR